MALLIDVNMPEWMTDEALRQDVLSILPNVDARIYEDMGDPGDIEMAAVTRLRPDLAGKLPNLQAHPKAWEPALRPWWATRTCRRTSALPG